VFSSLEAALPGKAAFFDSDALISTILYCPKVLRTLLPPTAVKAMPMIMVGSHRKEGIFSNFRHQVA
jgi:hypothetical protein